MDSALEIIAPIYALSGLPGNSSIALVDTPGPNEAKSEFLRHMVSHMEHVIHFVVHKDQFMHETNETYCPIL